ncbi:DUF5677 domain-containing protein [Pseudomonas syringae group genomosp. 3]|uniref:DUF5677 domain-containing protein n=1 Tax=Pseudomonas syringae group genomosp. 3 TaxID=251701 RepID=UPI0019073824|nr:DUF5677 domain-containing protein [Pseudomonas syringae group genomosp. 3]QQN26698.1 hypothetical protein JHZ65_24365 [Pseudomonas syringae pv. maculicola]
MSFDTEGFRGASGVYIREAQLQRHHELFTFAESCSKLAVEITALLPKSRGKTKLAVSLFFARCTSNFQAAVCLAEGGMTIEALGIGRSLLETFFVLNALAEEAVTADELITHDYASRRKHANAILDKIKIYENAAPFEKKLRDLVSENTGSTEINFQSLATKGNALAIYDGLYRHLSHHAAHPSLSATEPYLVELPSGQSHVQFRPILDYTPRAVLSACAGILISCFACDKAGIRTPETNAAGTRLWEVYETLYGTYDPWA